MPRPRSDALSPHFLLLSVEIGKTGEFGFMSTKTKLRVRAVSCDAKVIGSLVGGCRVTVRETETGRVLAQGLHLGGSGDTRSIMESSIRRSPRVFDTPGTACFETELDLSEPTAVEITVEGPLACSHALQRASKTTVLLPGEDVTGEGIVLELNGFIVDIMQPESVHVFHSAETVHVSAGVRLL